MRQRLRLEDTGGEGSPGKASRRLDLGLAIRPALHRDVLTRLLETAPDLRHATVYVSVLGSSRKRRASLVGLEAAHGVLQSRLARELRMKRTPQLTFEYDPTVERGVRMTRLIDELAPDDDDTDD